MVITELERQGFSQFYELFCELMHEGYGSFDQPLQEYFLNKLYTRDNLIRSIEAGYRKVFLAYEQDELKGFLTGDNVYGGIGFISWLGVEKSSRSKGTGKQLMQHYEEYAKTRLAHALELFAAPEVKTFYEKLGFVEIGRREQGYFGVKNIIMHKSLGDWNPGSLNL